MYMISQSLSKFFFILILIIFVGMFAKDYFYEKRLLNEKADQFDKIEISFFDKKYNTTKVDIESTEEISKIFNFIKNLDFHSRNRMSYVPTVNMKFLNKDGEIKYDFNLEKTSDGRSYLRNRSQVFYIETELSENQYKTLDSMLIETAKN